MISILPKTKLNFREFQCLAEGDYINKFKSQDLNGASDSASNAFLLVGLLSVTHIEILLNIS